MHLRLRWSGIRSWSLIALACLLPALLAGADSKSPPPGMVVFDGHVVNPARVLVRWKTPGDTVSQAARVEQVFRTEDAVILGARATRVTSEVYRELDGVGVIEFADAVTTQAALASGDAVASAAGADALSAVQLKSRIATLKASGQFEFVEPDYWLTTAATPSDVAFGDGRLWGLSNSGQGGGISGIDTQVVSAWDLTTGSASVIVAVIDTGIRYSHQDLAGNMWQNPGETPNNGIDDDGNGYVDDVFGINSITRTGNPMDDNGHGSHCAGTIGGTANDGGPLVGVAWTVRLMGLKFLSAGGGGNTSDAIRCIDYAVSKGAHIISGSYGGGGASQATSSAIERARQAGILCVFAAGNETNNNDSNPAYPASYTHDNIVSVAAVDRTGALANFSNYGATSVDIAAPGVAIFSCNFQDNGAYQTISGTSMATPHVAGVAALLKARFPNEDYAQLRERLLSSTRPLTSLQGRVATGGLVQARAAMDLSADGVIEVSIATVSPTPLRAGEPATLALRVSDRSPLPGATVTGTLEGVSLVFHDDGAAPDARANDGTYTVRTSVPAVPSGDLTLTISVTAPGKTPFNGSTSLPVVARATNDAFANPVTLDLATTPARGTNLNCSRETGEPAHAGNPGGRSVWWTWTAPSSGPMQLTTAGSSFDTILAVYTGNTLGSLAVVGSNDDSAGTQQSSVSFNATAGTTYRIAIDGYNGASGDIVLNATFTGSTPANSPPRFVRQPAAAVRVQQGETIRLTAEVAGTPAPTLQWTFNGTPLNNGGRISGATSVELVITNATATDGGNYQLTATNAAGSASSLVAVVTVDVALVRPPNDDFAQRAALVGTSAQATGTNTGATVESGEPAHAGVPPRRTVWWTWTAAQTGTATIDTFGSTFDTILAVYRGEAVNALAGIAANDDASDSRQSRVSFTAEAGRSYAIAVGSYGPDDGGTISLQLAQGAGAGEAPVITRQPLDLPMLEGFGGALAAAASGSQPLTYQWWKDGAPIQGAIHPVVLFDSAQLTDAGDYFVVATNPFGRATSETVTVTVAAVTAPPNDNFANAARIGAGGELVVARLGGATRESGEPFHADGDGGTMWWRWVPSASGVATISTDGSVADSGLELDTVLAVYTGSSLGSLNLLAENDDVADSLNSTVQFNAVAGTTYFIAVGGYSADDIGIVILTTPSAAVVSPNAAPTILLQPATYVATVGETIFFILGVAGSPAPQIQWQRSADGGVTWGDLADSDTISGANSLVLEVSGITESQNGRLVRAVVSNSVGSVTSTSAMLVVLPRPANDDFANAQPIAAGSSLIAGDNSGATQETGEPEHDTVGSASVWWTWQAPFTGPAVIETTGSTFDTVLAVYTGNSVGGLTALGSNDDAGDSRQSRVTFNAVAGTTYRVAVSGFAGDYGTIALSVPGDVPPALAQQPRPAVEVTAGGTVTVSAGIIGSPTPAMRWQRSSDSGGTWTDLADDATFSGTTSATLTIRDSSAALHGQQFRLVATNDYGSIVSSPSTLAVIDPDVQLINLSTRALSLGGDGVIIPGFFISGAGTKRVLMRAVGPKLVDFGVGNVMPDPTLSVFRVGETTAFATNDNWITQEPGRLDPAVVGASVSAFPLTPFENAPTNDTLSAAMVLDLAAGGYSTVAGDTANRSGIGIVEVYDVDTPNTGGPRLINVSNRGFVGTGDQVMIPGFVVNGDGPRRYLVRAVGPKLADFGLDAASLLANPRVTVMQGSSEIASNDDWSVQTDPEAGTSADVIALSQQVGAFSLSASETLPTDDQQSAALVVWLEPGGYTVLVSGAGGATGIVIAEVYEVP